MILTTESRHLLASANGGFCGDLDTHIADFFIPYMKRSDKPSRKSCR